ncbi:uncharacterized protein IL334_006945 [Kwoniella shivajii]|uniref:N-acetyltransferase domain-containing protein n=1 Tax=Kwoniella shivajii TaxID=564305 RepID=A0ABZ1D7D1_9TREE|nr:hypothetical protein IL334_006945 [Kwoniella shivajii]
MSSVAPIPVPHTLASSTEVSEIANTEAKVGKKNDSSEAIGKKAKVSIEIVSSDQLPSIAPRLASIVSSHMDLDMSTFFTFPYDLSSSLRLFTSITSSLIPLTQEEKYQPSFPPPAGGIILLVAKLYPDEKPLGSIDMEGNPTGNQDIVGSVQLGFSGMPNGAFRSEVKRMLVDVRYGGRGIGKALLKRLEAEAIKWGSTTCMLDTEQGSFGEKLYRSCGWTELGVLPKFHWPPDKSEKRSTVFFYKHLDEDEDEDDDYASKDV